MSEIPDDWRERAPMMDAAAWAGLRDVLQHVDAPRWNQTIGDRVDAAALEGLEAFREEIAQSPLSVEVAPGDSTLAWLDAMRPRLIGLDDLPYGFDLSRDFEALPTSRREDIVRRLEDIVPRDLGLDDAIIYSTSGTTGHPVIIPSHPGCMVKNLAHLELLGRLHGAPIEPVRGAPTMLNISAQQRTYVFACAMAGWNGATFAKINLSAHDWGGGGASRHRFCGDFAPQIIASEPLTMAEMLRLELPVSPRLLVSSAVTLTPAHAARVAEGLGCAVVDLYSSTETGPIAATVPGVDGHAILLPDVYVEVLDEDDNRVPDGTRGELAVTGGRNPFLPLVRYRTGDYGKLGTARLPDGRSVRVIRDLEGRAPVMFRALDGRPISSVDVARSVRPIGPFVQHTFRQSADGAVELRLRPIPDIPVPIAAMEHALRGLFGDDAAVSVVLDEQLGLGTGKPITWQSELD